MSTFTSAISIIGIAAGTASLIFVLALARGFRAEIEKAILANTPQIAIYSIEDGTIDNWKSLKTDVSRIDGVSSVRPQSSIQSLVASSDRTAIVELTTENITSTEGDGEKPISADLGSELAKKLHVNVGDEVETAVILDDGSAHKTKLSISSISSTGIYELDEKLVSVSAAALRTILATNELKPQLLRISLDNIDRTEEVEKHVRQTIADRNLSVLSWKEANRPVFKALEHERLSAIAFLAVILLLAILNIAATLSINVNEHRLDLAVFKTAGASRRSITAIYLIQAALLAVVGIISGLIIGWLACYFANAWGLFRLPPEVYSISTARSVPAFGDAIAVSAIVLAASLISAVVPALKASRLRPYENLRRA